MRARVPELDWRIMDIRELEQHASTLGGPGTWDVIVDKGVYFLLFILFTNRHDGCPHGREWVCVES